MQSFKSASLFGALLFTGMLAAQTPAPGQPPAAAPAASVQAPNPGQGGVGAPTEAAAPLTHEEQEAKLKADVAHVTEMQAAALARQLSLTPPQIQKLKPILAERQQKMRDAAAQPADSLADRRVRIDQIREETQTRIEAILGPAQKTQFERLIATRRGGRSIRASRPAGPPAAPGVHTAPTRPKAVIQPAAPSPAAPAASPSTPAAPAPPAAAPQSHD